MTVQEAGDGVSSSVFPLVRETMTLTIAVRGRSDPPRLHRRRLGVTPFCHGCFEVVGC
jgi:hypothetical protein